VSELRHTPVYDLHVALGARMVEFGGFAMPVQYSSILKEHRAVRERAGLFDVSHMGQLHLRGAGAVAFAERLVTCPVASLKPGRVRYGVLCRESGGSVDDVTVYRLAAEHLFLCVNAANIEKDRDWVASHAPAAGVELADRSDDTGLLALQGPLSARILEGLGAEGTAALRRFTFLETKVAGRPALVSRTGYTGSDGFELYLAAEDAAPLFQALLDAGHDTGVEPVGLGARDTLRLEAALALYGHELDDETTPLEAGLERFVKLEAGGFIGAEALARQAREGPPRRLVGFELEERGVARADHPIVDAQGRAVGRVTSGAPSPTLGKSIGLGYVPPALAEVGSELGIVIRERCVRARVVPIPFYRRGS
jgi:aminomethyltransferase